MSSEYECKVCHGFWNTPIQVLKCKHLGQYQEVKIEKKQPREFWIITLGDFTPSGVMKTKESADSAVDLIRRSNDPNVVHVREVVPIDWDSIWSQYREDDIAALDTEQIEQLVEKQLKGEG